MFDNPKKELERLQEQLLAAESKNDEEFDDFSKDIMEELEEEDRLYDAELDALLSGTDRRTRRRSEAGDVSGRATGFDADDYEMDSDRYVPAPKKRSIGCLTFFGLLQAIAVIFVIAWLLRRML